MITLVIGGSGSGKSEYAENLTLNLQGEKIYIATMIAYDEECEKRILKHQNMRKHKGFKTLEYPFDIDKIKIKSDIILLECMGNLLANEMYSQNTIYTEHNIVEKIFQGILHLKNCCENLVIVSNDVFCDDMTLYKESLDYIENLATLNKKIAQISDDVCELVFSIPLKIKKVGETNG